MLRTTYGIIISQGDLKIVATNLFIKCSIMGYRVGIRSCFYTDLFTNQFPGVEDGVGIPAL